MAGTVVITPGRRRGGGVGGDGEMLFAVEARGARSEEEVIASSCGVQISSRSLQCLYVGFSDETTDMV